MDEHEDTPVRIRRRGETRTYAVIDASCLGASCFEPIDAQQIGGGFQCGTLKNAACPRFAHRGFSSTCAALRHSQHGWVLEE